MIRPWSKRIPLNVVDGVSYAAEIRYDPEVDGKIRVFKHSENSEGHEFTESAFGPLTINQAGDLVHGLEEAIRHAGH